jgi:hypothetical protein
LDDQVPQALAALQLNSSTEGEWVPDTCATAHIIDDPGNLYTLKYYDGPDSVVVRNGTELPITYTGHAHVFTSGSPLLLNNVLVDLLFLI